MKTMVDWVGVSVHIGDRTSLVLDEPFVSLDSLCHYLYNRTIKKSSRKQTASSHTRAHSCSTEVSMGIHNPPTHDMKHVGR